MNFNKFNKERLFNVNTAGFEYFSLEELYNKNSKDKVYQVQGLYIGTKSEFDPEVPIVALEDKYVNIPVHQLAEVQAMLSDKAAVRAIRDGECGFTISTYYQQKYKKTCYKAVWCNYEPDDEGEDLTNEFGE